MADAYGYPQISETGKKLDQLVADEASAEEIRSTSNELANLSAAAGLVENSDPDTVDEAVTQS